MVAEKLTTEMLCTFHSGFGSSSVNAVLTKATAFLHFGTLSEYVDSCQRIQEKDALVSYTREDEDARPSIHPRAIVCNCEECSINGPVQEPVAFMECKSVKFPLSGHVLLEGLNYIAFIDNFTQGLCIEDRMINEKCYRLVYGFRDDFKPKHPSELKFRGMWIDGWAKCRGLENQDISPEDGGGYLLTANLWSQDQDAGLLEGYW